MRAEPVVVLLAAGCLSIVLGAWGGAEGQGRGSWQAEGGRLRFRLLEVRDFQASFPPLHLAHRPGQLDAASCVSIVAVPELVVDFPEEGRRTPDHPVSAHLIDPRFVAIFDARCSWWNRSPVDPEYTLQHEQLHFAIAEHEARRLSRDMKGSTLRAVGSDRARALANLTHKLELLTARARERALRVHSAFDAETLSDRSPHTQRRWLERYEALLGVSLRR